ncbi:ubiquitin carboxyl-terminal hydrolase cyld-like [Plakobranchus ocellatus]|uniref:Ubiquitin carboxyl-terminal hydrolase cyld-like n=1 Tax=Plakobranchus ocellatus TaxID=259542 RepID=A0AAV4BBE1_9GAST|nr:ubiquitin carboxyl-terminal hydrolase cyld-like [Plakobranchus ocellatus]
MSDIKDGNIFILLRTKRGVKKGNSQSSSEPCLEVLAGSLLLLVEQISSPGRIEYELKTLDAVHDCEPGTSVIVTCTPGEEIDALPRQVLELLRPIPTCRERLEVYRDASWLEDGIQLKAGHYVFVKLKGELSEVRGLLRVRVPDSKGILFGIELEEGVGNSDGKYKGVDYFKTKLDHAVFVALHKVRRNKAGWQAKTRMRAGAEGEELYQAANMSGKTPLSVGERIVWMSDEGPEKGVVKWIGCLPGDISSNITVGVEFDQPVGSGTGKFRDKRLFFAKQGHASLIPVMGLMKESEFDGSEAFKNDLGYLQETELQKILYPDLPPKSASEGYQNSPDFGTEIFYLETLISTATNYPTFSSRSKIPLAWAFLHSWGSGHGQRRGHRS